MAVLREASGNREFPLQGKLTIIGRDPACDIVANSPMISGRHVMLLNSGGLHSIEDLDSLNGTFVNGQRLTQRVRLSSGDRIELFGLCLTFHDDEQIAVAEPLKMSRPPHLTDERPRGATIRAADLMAAPPVSVLSSLEIGGDLRLAVKPEAKLRAVLEISRCLSHSLDWKVVLPQILESLFSIFPQADCGFILLRDQNTGELVPNAVKHRCEHTGESVPLSCGIIQQALLSGCAILSADAGSDTRFEAHASIKRLEIRSIMCVPIHREGGDCMGVIQLDSRDKTNQFQQEDLDLLTCTSLLAARAVELARLHEERRELEAATQIQQSFLPARRPECAGLQFFDHYSPAMHIGGDYYDYIPLPGNRLAVAVGDVAGKGISAALLMARLSAAARVCLANAPSLPEAVRHLNLLLTRSGSEDRFMTFVVAVLDLDQYLLTVVNAGHLPPLLRRAGQATVEELEPELAGLPLGVMDRPYEQVQVALRPGDALVLYTDGVSEMRNRAGEMYGVERVRAAVQNAPADMEGLGTTLLTDVQRFAEQRPPGDDLTILCLGRTRE